MCEGKWDYIVCCTYEAQATNAFIYNNVEDCLEARTLA